MTASFFRVRYRLQGLNIARVLSILTEKNISLYHLIQTEVNTIQFSIASIHEKMLLEIVGQSTKLTLTKLKNSLQKKVQTQLLFTSFCLLLVGILLVLTGFVFQVKIEGVEAEVRQAVAASLRSQNIKTGMLKSRIAIKKAETRLKNDVEGLALVNLSFKGSTLLVAARQKILVDEGKIQFTDIKAPVAGRVLDVNVVSGTALVKRGDIVEAGEPLIGAYVIRAGALLKVAAIGEVNFSAFIEESVSFSENDIELQRTGRKTEVKYWTFLQKKAKIGKSKIAYALYETKEKIKDKAFMLLFPLKLFVNVVYELKEVPIYESFTSAKPRLIAETMQRAEKQVKDYTILSKHSVERALGNGKFEVVSFVEYERVVT